MRRDWLKFLALLVPVLTGCLSHTRKLQQPKLAGAVMNADAVQLVEAVNRRYDQINSMTATVDFAASVGGAHSGKQTDYTSFHGFILFRKPQMLRVIGQVPVIRTIAFNLASNGDTFTLVIPPRSRAIQGSASVTTRAANPMENLRPGVFLDAIVIQRIAPDRIVSLINSSSNTIEPRTKQLIETPQYDLTISKPGERSSPGGLPQVDKALRVIHFSRINLMPTEQDIYNADGDVETQIIYGPYQDFNGTQYPATITINRLLDEYRITLTVEKLVLNPVNPPLTDESFELEVPKGYKVQKMP
jgi:outer membrane lipoprotein-sorting protein